MTDSPGATLLRALRRRARACLVEGLDQVEVLPARAVRPTAGTCRPQGWPRICKSAKGTDRKY